jgi:Zn-finger nucleic acid-binding protein
MPILRCPRDDSPLDAGKEHGIDVDACPTCKGAWFDQDELALLESSVADEDSRRGMIDYAKRKSDLQCPVCKEAMQAFNYRAYNLELDACVNEHGFWLDAGESKRVRDVMAERVSGLRRAGVAEKDWFKLKRGGGGGVIDGIKGLFRGGRR